MGKLVNLVGKKFGKLLVVKRADNRNNSVFWLCKCDCGNEVVVRGDSLKQGKTQSCSCLQKEKVKKVCKKNFIKHGLSKSRLSNIWFNIKQRCNNPKSKNYQYYGAKNIQICCEWLEFKNFYNWAINNGYADNLSIDRIDVNGNYEPLNCRWTDYKIQENNRSNNVVVEYDNEAHTIAEWSRIVGIKYTTLLNRIKKGWNVEKALTTPTKAIGSPR